MLRNTPREHITGPGFIIAVRRERGWPSGQSMRYRKYHRWATVLITQCHVDQRVEALGAVVARADGDLGIVHGG